MEVVNNQTVAEKGDDSNDQNDHSKRDKEPGRCRLVLQPVRINKSNQTTIVPQVRYTIDVTDRNLLKIPSKVAVEQTHCIQLHKKNIGGSFDVQKLELDKVRF